MLSTIRPSRTSVLATNDPAAKIKIAGVIIAETTCSDGSILEAPPNMADDLDLPPEIPVFGRYWNEGDFFMAHEVLEGLWVRNRDEGLRGLIQLAVALYHIECGNRKGARTMIERARPRLKNPRNSPYGIDLAMMDAYAARVGAVLAAGEPDAGELNKIVAARPRI